MQIKIEKIIYPGKSLAHIDDKVVLTNNGLEGEVVECFEIKHKKNYVQAKTKSIIQSSKHRTSVKCKHFNICSSYQYIDYDHQIQIKNSQLKEIFDQFKISYDSFNFYPAKNIWGYRNKIHFHIVKENGCYVCAYHTPKTVNKFTAVDRCFLASDLMNKFVFKFLEIINNNKIENVNEVILQRSQSGKKFLLCCFGTSNKKDLKKLSPLIDIVDHFSVSGIVYINRKKNKKEVIFGKDQLAEQIGSRKLFFGSLCFFQINIPMLELLIENLKKILKSKSYNNLIDLYSGVGTFAIALSDIFSNIIAVESSKSNAYFLNKNTSVNSISNIKLINNKCEFWVKNKTSQYPQVIIVDPPRRGLDNKVIEKINKLKPDLFIYISCDPVTLSRDLRKIDPIYKIRNISGYDFFPHTPHIETVALLEKQ